MFKFKSPTPYNVWTKRSSITIIHTIISKIDVTVIHDMRCCGIDHRIKRSRIRSSRSIPPSRKNNQAASRRITIEENKYPNSLGKVKSLILSSIRPPSIVDFKNAGNTEIIETYLITSTLIVVGTLVNLERNSIRTDGHVVKKVVDVLPPTYLLVSDLE